MLRLWGGRKAPYTNTNPYNEKVDNTFTFYKFFFHILEYL